MASARRERNLPAPPALPRDVVHLSDAEQLGKEIFFDQRLSSPPGLSCATCHVPKAGFTGENSALNNQAGPMPGIVHGRAGRRKPQAVAYTSFSPAGPYYDGDLGQWVGGTFWDGHAPDTTAQAKMPFIDADEMANVAVGPYPPQSGGFAPHVATRLRHSAYAHRFVSVFGPDAFGAPDEDIYNAAATAVAAYESSAEVNPFSSMFDASPNGTPPMNGYSLTPSEQNGMSLFFGQAQCSTCHSAASVGAVLEATGGKDTFTTYAYSNIGVPRNPANPFYAETDCASNPHGCNPLGANFIDYGLGANPNPSPNGTRFMNTTPGDIAQFRGLFKAPSVRNVNKRANAGFVKAYMHNGVFKSLEQVVDFYNRRNIAVNAAGDEIPFDLRVGPPAGYTPVFPPPEVLDNVQNVAGASPAEAGADVATNGRVGNLGLSASEEADLVNFLGALSDGFTRPSPAE
jgi:cytochrome c peroxidase